MEKIKSKVKDFIMSCRQTFAIGKNKVMLGLMTLSYMLCCPSVAFAAEDDFMVKSKDFVTTGIDFIFMFLAGMSIYKGGMRLYNGITQYIDGGRDGNSQKEGSDLITSGLLFCVLGVAVFALKKPLLELLTSMW